MKQPAFTGERLPLGRVPLVIAAWLAVSLIFAAVQSTTELDPSKPVLFLLFANVIHFGVWALMLPLLAWLVRRCPLQHGAIARHVAVLFPCCLIIAFCVSVSYLTLVNFTWFPLREHFPTYRSVLRHGVDLFVQMDLLTCVLFISSLHAWRWFQAYRSEQLRNAELETRLANSHLNALRMQLHPHFLFNTLHSIAGLIREDGEAARRMTIALGDFLRLTLEENAVALRSLGDELEFVRLYVAIEKMRLGERMSIEYRVSGEAVDALLPYLLLQPLVENAIRHGVARIARPAGIWLRAERLNGHLHLALENDGPERAHEFKKGVGITNTLERLRLHYGDAFEFSFSNRENGGSLVDLMIPYRTAP